MIDRAATGVEPDMLVLRAAVVAAVLAFPALAHAAEPARGPSFSVETDPSCEDARASLVAQIALACEAASVACAVGIPPASSSVRLHLSCPASSSWSLQRRDRSDAMLWTVPLEGTPDERVHSAAMRAVRLEVTAHPFADGEDRAVPKRPSSSPPIVEREEPTVASERAPETSPRATVGKVLTFTGFSVAVVSAAVAVGLGIHAKSQLGEVTFCKPTCPESQVESARSTTVAGDIALTTAISGAIGGVVGVILWATAPTSTKSPTTGKQAITPAVGFGTLGLSAAF